MEIDTIYALATPRGRSGVAVIRISGSKAREGLRQLTTEPIPRKASLRRLIYSGEFLDEALVIVFPGPNSFTGEDVVELQIHGSIATSSAVLHALSTIDGFRLAEAGEFTRRALENERLDLAQVEGLADLVEAETEAQRKHALRTLSGAMGDRVGEWRRKLIRAAALIEATIDFADEDVPTDVMPEVLTLLKSVRAELMAEREGIGAAERIREGFEVAIVGPPNAGKSTLLNALAGREAAITSEVAGTTRDVIEVRMEIAGLPVTLLDTAGIRESDDEIESLGIGLAKRRAKDADLRVILQTGMGTVLEAGPEDIVVTPKADLGSGDFSAKTGYGLDDLVNRIGAILSTRSSNAGVLNRERHRVAIIRAIDALGIVEDRLNSAPEMAELIAEDVRTSVLTLDSLLGRVDVEHLLDEIFSSFCIGK